ncbi:MAG TPA: DNA primase [Bryobacteraceae bacterium]|jgi:DNA primase|nr:DNA primase [Bryobacteraceae bacterium]
MNFSEQLKNQLNIVDVVGQYVRLKRQGGGSRYVGLCPFHSEKTPSFGVHSVLQYYKCFGCDAAGDVFKFVQEIESLTFPETLKLLADRYGIPMPERQRSDDPEAQRRAAIFEMHEIAADLFQKNLRASPGAEARNYLQSRNVSKAAMDEFRLGLSEPSGQQLVQKLERFGPALMEESGLLGKRQDGSGFFDRFRARLMFPIHNESGKIIGFGARALRPNDEPKYLNSPETRIYKKSSVLYNLHRAKIDARKHDRVILVEGYMDVIGVYSAGLHEVVASSGTSLALEQVRTIKRQVAQQQASTGQIILNFDSDAAGARSTEKYISVLLAEGLRVKVLTIPGGLDPDEYIQQNGVEAYQRLLADAASYFHWLADRAREKFDMRTAEGRVDAFKFILPSIEQVHDPVERSAIANEMAANLNVDRDVIRQSLRRSTSAEPASRAPQVASAIPPNEKLLLASLLISPEARAAIKHYLAGTNILHILELRSIFETALALDAESIAFSLEALASRLEPRLQRIVTEVSFSDLGIGEADAAQQALHCLRALETKSVNVQCEALRRRIRESEQGGNLAEAMRLTDELDKIRRASSGS